MAALIAIIFVTVTALAGLRLFAPPALRSGIGPCEFAAAAALPILATFAQFYALFAIGVAVIIIGIPSLFGGTAGRAARLDQQLRLGCFALPLMPIFYRDVTVSTFTVMQLNYVIIVSGALAGAMLTSGVRLPNGRLATWDLTFAAMVLAQLFMDVRGDDLLFAMRATLQLSLALALPYFVFSRAIAMSADPHRLLLALLVATASIASVAIFEAIRSWLLYNGMNASVGADLESISGYGKLRGGLLRPRATWPESTGLSLFFAVALTMVYALRREIASKAFVRVLGGVLAAGLFFTFARVGYVAVVVGITACFAYERRYLRLALLAAAVPIAAAGLFALARIVPMIGVSIGIADDAADTFNYREMLLRDGLALWRDNWLIGVSGPELLARLDHLRQGEGIIDIVNQPLAILMRGGIVFAAVYFAMTIRLLATLFARRRRLDRQARALACATFAGLLTLIAGLFTTSFGRNETTFVILLAIGAGTLARRTKPAVQPAPAPSVAATPAVR